MKARQEAKELIEAMLDAMQSEDNVKKAKACALVAIEAMKEGVILAKVSEGRQSPKDRIEAVRLEIVNL